MFRETIFLYVPTYVFSSRVQVMILETNWEMKREKKEHEKKPQKKPLFSDSRRIKYSYLCSAIILISR